MNDRANTTIIITRAVLRGEPTSIFIRHNLNLSQQLPSLNCERPEGQNSFILPLTIIPEHTKKSIDMLTILKIQYLALTNYLSQTGYLTCLKKKSKSTATTTRRMITFLCPQFRSNNTNRDALTNT